MKKKLVVQLVGAVAVFGMTGCAQSFQNVVSDPLAQAAQQAPLRVKINLKSWKVDYQGPAGWGIYNTTDDPTLMGQVQAEISRRLEESGAIKVVERPEDADAVVDVTVQITSHPSIGALVLTYANYGLAFLPSLLGSPMTWGTFTTASDFTVANRQGQTVAHLQNSDDRGHVIGIYYGRRNLSEPFGPELKTMLGSLVDFLQKNRATIVGPAQGAA